MTNIETLGNSPAASPRSRRSLQSDRAARLRRWASVKNIGAIYVWILLIVVFSIWAPETFPTWATVRQVLNQEAITGLMALALVLPLATRVFDVSIGYNLGLANVLFAWMIVRGHHSVFVAIVTVVAVAVLVGLVNAVVVVHFQIESLIGTLATGSLLLAAITLVSGQTQIVGSELTVGSVADIAGKGVGGINAPVFYMIIVAAAIWILLDYTVIGRWLYATGFNPVAARMAGIPVRMLTAMMLVVSALISGAVAGITLTSQISSGATDVGPPYLLPAFAAVFLGATQLRQGLFNAWGTVIAVLMLGTGQVGLGLVGAPTWAPAVFTGVVLLAALGVTRAEQKAGVGH